MAVLSKLLKAGTKEALQAAKKPLSSASKKAKEYGAIYMDQEVKAITKGKGNWRYIILKDGTTYPVTKDVASDLIRHSGMGAQAVKFGLERGESRVDQAFKSLLYHESRSNPFMSKELIKSNYKDYLKQVKETGLGEAAPYSLVKRGGKVFTMPSQYADLLEKEGHLKVMERLK